MVTVVEEGLDHAACGDNVAVETQRTRLTVTPLGRYLGPVEKILKILLGARTLVVRVGLPGVDVPTVPQHVLIHTVRRPQSEGP